MTRMHRTFISFHHEDDPYKLRFEALFSERIDILISTAVSDGDIDTNTNTDEVRRIIRDEYLRNSTVTVVLVGRDTWSRKHIDWEISASIRQTKASLRSGLLGILLPTHPDIGKEIYDPYIIPPRLYKNIECGYAELYDWTENPATVQQWIHEAFLRRRTILPNNRYPMFANNRSGARWQN